MSLLAAIRTWLGGASTADANAGGSAAMAKVITVPALKQESGGLWYEVGRSVPFSGKQVVYDDNRKTVERVFRKGQKNSVTIFWPDSKEKSQHGTFKDGMRDGLWIEWHVNGQKESEGRYKAGKKDGLWVFWHDNGLKHRKVRWNDGRKNFEESWDRSGNHLRVNTEAPRQEFAHLYAVQFQDESSSKSLRIETLSQLATDSRPEQEEQIHWATRKGFQDLKGFQDIVETCLDEGADVNLLDGQGRTPLDVALESGQSKVAEFLKQKGGRRSPKLKLWKAVERGDTKSLREHIEIGASPDTTDEQGNTLLHLAAALGHVDTIEWLLEQGAGVNIVNARGEHPLQRAAVCGQQAAVELLLKQGADTEHRSASGQSAAGAALTSGFTSLANWLIDHGSPATMAEAIQAGNLKAVEKWMAQKKRGKAPETDLLLVQAAAAGQIPLVESLLERSNVDAAPPYPGFDEWTALHHASASGHFETVGLLLDKGANMDARTGEGQAALHLAVVKGAAETVKQLLGAGSNPMAVDTQGCTPLDLVGGDNRTKIVSLLTAHGADSFRKLTVQARTKGVDRQWLAEFPTTKPGNILGFEFWREYLVSQSSDLKQWQPLGKPISGDGKNHAMILRPFSGRRVYLRLTCSYFTRGEADGRELRTEQRSSAKPNLAAITDPVIP